MCNAKRYTETGIEHVSLHTHKNQKRKKKKDMALSITTTHPCPPGWKVAVVGDANAALAAEVQYGAAAGAHVAVLVSVGTGIGR